MTRRGSYTGPLVAVALLAGAVVVWSSSRAAFTATTATGTNTFAAGTVAITDNKSGAALFTATNLAPGDTGTACLGVQYNGTLTPTAIKVYANQTTAQEQNNGLGYGGWTNGTTAEVDDYLNMLIQVSSADLTNDPLSSCAPAGVGTFADVTAATPGTLMRTMIASNNAYSNGFTVPWGTVTAGKWRVFKFVYTFSTSATDTAQNDGLKVSFVWEAQR